MSKSQKQTIFNNKKFKDWFYMNFVAAVWRRMQQLNLQAILILENALLTQIDDSWDKEDYLPLT